MWRALPSRRTSERPGLLQQVERLLRGSSDLPLRLVHQPRGAGVARQVGVPRQPGPALVGPRVRRARAAGSGATLAGGLSASGGARPTRARGLGGWWRAAERLGEGLVRLAQPLEDAVQPGPEAAQVLPVVTVRVKDAAGVEVGELDLLGGR